jgi:hypothetical protein
MHASLAPLDPFEMLDRIGHIHVRARNIRVVESLVQYSPGWSDKRLALAIFHVTGLLANKYHGCLFRPLAEDGLCRAFV